MLYTEARDRIKGGDILAFHGRSVFSRLIRWRTHSVITHVGFAKWIEGRLCVVEAREGHGVRVFPLSRYLARGEAVHWYGLPERFDRLAAQHDALQHWGQRYASPWQFVRSFGFLTRWICDRLGLGLDTDPDRFFCSELVADVLGVPDAAKVPPGEIPALIGAEHMGRLEWDQ